MRRSPQILADAVTKLGGSVTDADLWLFGIQLLQLAIAWDVWVNADGI
jgi:hypothetical protein